MAAIPVRFSPFCGSADSLKGDGIIIVGDREVASNNYIGLIGSKCFNAWKFVSEFPDNTLLCSGGELLIALGQEEIYGKGQLYKLHPRAKSARRVR